jgi:DNA-binding transcriptional LysR family regulator
MTDRIFSLRLFVRAARTASFSRAGREMNVSQPTASRILAALERELGAGLFHRTTRAVRLTEAGADYLQRVESILDALDEADYAARGGGELKGLLRVGVSSSFGLREVVPRLRPFLERHPALRLDLSVSDQRHDLLLDGIDVAFRLGRLEASGLLARKLGEAERVLVASPDYLALGAAIDHPSKLRERCLVIGPAAAPAKLIFERDGVEASVNVEGRVTCANNEGAVALACAGLGLTATSAWGVARELSERRLVRVLADWRMPPVELHAVFPPARAVAPAARALVDHMAAAFRAAATGGG